MEIFEAKKMTDETLTGVSSISQPSLDETVGDGSGSVVVTTTVVETTEVSVVKVVQNDIEDEVMENVEKGGWNEGVENEIEGLFGNFSGGDDGEEGVNVNSNVNATSFAIDVEASLAGDDAEIAENGNRIYDEEDVESMEEDHNFVVGDFVWVKIKNHTWWPGQIYDPSDASETAAKTKHKGQILVAHFGDGSFSWCTPSQLKPFIDHFPEMSKQSDSKKFVNSVHMALEEIGKLVEVGLKCKCQTVDPVDHAGVVNRGVKVGVVVPKGNTIKVLMDRIEPVELLSMLKDSATMDPGAELAQLNITLLKSWLNAFYSKKGGYLLVKYHDPKCIEGLEDELESGVVVGFDINGPYERTDDGDDKLNQRRKQKSVAELLREDEPTVKKARKRKSLVVSVTPEVDHESGGVEEDMMSPRQRKKSKYLSPPYLSPVGGRLSVFGSGSGSFKEPEPEPEPEPEHEPEQFPDAKKVSLKKSSGKKTRKNRGVHEGYESQEEQKKVVSADVDVKKVLHGLIRVALDSTSYMEKNLPVITTFISSYRSSVFKEGSSQNEGRVNDQKRNVGGTSDVAFIKQKLESMIEIVKGCEETKMKAELKASLEGGLQEVLQKVGKIKGK